jgi:hypothetical protein
MTRQAAMQPHDRKVGGNGGSTFQDCRLGNFTSKLRRLKPSQILLTLTQD